MLFPKHIYRIEKNKQMNPEFLFYFLTFEKTIFILIREINENENEFQVNSTLICNVTSDEKRDV